jgi:hypothetical protein
LQPRKDLETVIFASCRNTTFRYNLGNQGAGKVNQQSPCRSCRKRSVRVLTVFGAADLDLLKPWARRFDSIRVNWVGHTEEQNEAIRTVVERDYLECGCSTARITLFATAITLIAIALFQRATISTWSGDTWVIFISTIVLVPMTAKLIGVVRARIRLAEFITELQRDSFRLEV